MRRAARVDANQGDIVDALRGVGCSVTSLAAVGQGVPDLLVGWLDPRTGDRELALFEVKDGAKPPSKRKLTDRQVDWHAEWRGRPVVVVETVEQALEAVGVRADHV